MQRDDAAAALLQMLSLKIEPSVFHAQGCDGDFEHMVGLDKHNDTLFLFFENYKDMCTKRTPGAGTAVLRPMSYDNAHLDQDTPPQLPRAMGIPTGWSVKLGGYTLRNRKAYDLYVRPAIDISINKVALLVAYAFMVKKPYKTVVYSCDPDNSKLIGGGVFAKTLDHNIKQYISRRINQGIKEKAHYFLKEMREHGDFETYVNKGLRMMATQEEKGLMFAENQTTILELASENQELAGKLKRAGGTHHNHHVQTVLQFKRNHRSN